MYAWFISLIVGVHHPYPTFRFVLSSTATPFAAGAV